MKRGEVIACLADIIRDLATGGDTAAAAGTIAALASRMGGDVPATAATAPQLALAPDGGEPIVAPEGAEADPAREAAASLLRVFQHWQKATGKRRARLLPGRASKIRARLRQFTEAELCAAIDGALLSDFHRGDNDEGTEYLDLRTLFKNGEVVEGHIERAGALPDAPALDNDPHAQRVAELRAAAADATRDGRTDDYNAFNAELRQLLGR